MPLIGRPRPVVQPDPGPSRVRQAVLDVEAGAPTSNKRLTKWRRTIDRSWGGCGRTARPSRGPARRSPRRVAADLLDVGADEDVLLPARSTSHATSGFGHRACDSVARLRATPPRPAPARWRCRPGRTDPSITRRSPATGRRGVSEIHGEVGQRQPAGVHDGPRPARAQPVVERQCLGMAPRADRVATSSTNTGARRNAAVHNTRLREGAMGRPSRAARNSRGRPATPPAPQPSPSTQHRAKHGPSPWRPTARHSASSSWRASTRRRNRLQHALSRGPATPPSACASVTSTYRQRRRGGLAELRARGWRCPAPTPRDRRRAQQPVLLAMAGPGGHLRVG